MRNKREVCDTSTYTLTRSHSLCLNSQIDCTVSGAARDHGEARVSPADPGGGGGEAGLCGGRQPQPSRLLGGGGE